MSVDSDAGPEAGGLGTRGGVTGSRGPVGGGTGASGVDGGVFDAGAGGADVGAAGTGAGSVGGSGASGLDTSWLLRELDAGEQAQLCTWGASLPGFGAPVDCGDGSEVTFTLHEAECAAMVYGSACAATVGDFEACTLALAERPCDDVAGLACGTLFSCR